MEEIKQFLKSIGFKVVFEENDGFRALYSSKGINLYIGYQSSVLRIWYHYHTIKRQILSDSFIEKAEDLQFILSRNVYLKNEFPFMMKQIQDYKPLSAESL